MPNRSKVSKVAVSGRWVAAARSWLAENAPCTKGHAIIELAQIMPLRVRLRGGRKVSSRLDVALEALRRIYGTPFEELPTTLEAVKAADRTGATATILALAGREEGVAAAELTHLKGWRSLLGQLRQRGQVVQHQGKFYRYKDTAHE